MTTNFSLTLWIIPNFMDSFRFFFHSNKESFSINLSFAIQKVDFILAFLFRNSRWLPKSLLIKDYTLWKMGWHFQTLENSKPKEYVDIYLHLLRTARKRNWEFVDGLTKTMLCLNRSCVPPKHKILSSIYRFLFAVGCSL